MNTYTVLYYEKPAPGDVAQRQNMEVEACCKLSAKAIAQKQLPYAKIADVRLKGDG